MDPKVCVKLLTHHRKGSKVDVEPLRDRFPLRQITGEGPQMGSLWNRNLRWRKKYYRGSLWYWGNSSEFIGRELGLEEPRGAHKPGGALPPGRAQVACGPPVGFLASSPSLLGSLWKENHRRILFRLDSVWYSLSIILKNKEKTETGTGH